MSDEDENTGDHILGGAGFEIPAGLLRRMNQEHDKQHMRMDIERAREERFLDGLDVEGLLALDWILSSNPDNAFANNCRYAGIIDTLLRVVHKVNSKGEPLDQIPQD